MKPKFLKLLFDETNYQMYMKFIHSAKIPYTITRSNYTLKIESEILNVHFMQNVMSKKAFMCGAMVQADLKKSGVEMPEINRAELDYFSFNIPDILRKKEGETIYNIDIKSAYANALNVNKLLSEKTYNYLCSLSKKDRLAAVGMLASRKDVFYQIGRAHV